MKTKPYLDYFKSAYLDAKCVLKTSELAGIPSYMARAKAELDEAHIALAYHDMSDETREMIEPLEQEKRQLFQANGCQLKRLEAIRQQIREILLEVEL